MRARRRRGVKKFAATVALGLIATLVGCEGEQVRVGPKTADMAAERARLASKVKKKQSARAKAKIAKAGEAEAEPNGVSVMESNQHALEELYTYDPSDMRDPFRSIFWERKSVAETEVRGPLEQYEVGQLAVVAVVWENSRPRALVMDPTGESYVVREGSRIGKNDGLVIHIGDNLVLVKETYVDFAGEQSTKDVEMRIRRSQGG
jgi:Tfp pilus assembly protein PilP